MQFGAGQPKYPANVCPSPPLAAGVCVGMWGGGREGRLGSAVSERGYVGFDFPLPALSRTERYYLL